LPAKRLYAKNRNRGPGFLFRLEIPSAQTPDHSKNSENGQWNQGHYWTQRNTKTKKSVSEAQKNRRIEALNNDDDSIYRFQVTTNLRKSGGKCGVEFVERVQEELLTGHHFLMLGEC
jgi:hypothetical protein